MKSIDFRTLLIGLLLGICVTLSMGQRAAEPAHKLDADYRYQISAAAHVDNNIGGVVHTVFILDHETNKVHAHRWNWNTNDAEVKWMIKN